MFSVGLVSNQYHMPHFSQRSWVRQRGTSQVRVRKSRKISIKCVFQARLSFVYQVFIFLLQTTANNYHGRRVYVKKIA